MPSRAGDWATSASRRPIRFRCSKCWSMITPGSRPRPALIWVMRCFGVAPLVPKATMWVLMAEAPALVPATIAPCRWRSMIARPSPVPPITLDRRSWLPPVMKMPVASRTASIAAGWLASSRVSGRRPRTSGMPSERKSDWYSSVASSPERGGRRDDRHARIGPPAREAKRDRIWRCRSLSSAPPMISRCPARGPPDRSVGGMSRRSLPSRPP